MKRKLHLPPLVLLWRHLAECNHVHPRSECGAVRGLKKWAVLRYRYPNPSWFFYQKNLPYKVSLAAPISKISMVKMFKHVFLFLPHADFSPGPSEPQFGTSTCTTLHLDLRNSDNKKGDQAFYDYDFSWIFFPNNDIRMLKWYHTRLDYMGRFAIQEGLGQLFHSPCVLFGFLVHAMTPCAVCIFPLGWICRLNFATAFCQGPGGEICCKKQKESDICFSYIWSYDRTRYLDLLVEGEFILWF